MKKIIVTVGISGSGKSTFAHEQWKANPTGVVVVNRDSIRNLLFGFTDQTIQEYYTRLDLNKLEKQVTKYEDTLINEALCEDKTVIVDATHLEKKYLSRFEYWNVPIEYKYFDISVKDAIERDSKRSRKVGAEIIKKQYEKYLNLQRQGIPLLDFKPVELDNNINKQACYVFDIDGCLADNNGTRSPFDWSKVGEDLPIKSVVDVFNDINVSNEWKQFIPLYICSGRDEICREETEKWLNKYLDDSEVILMMRKEGDMRPDWIVKQEMAREIVKNHYINAWYDDRIQVTRHLRALGIKVFNVEYNNF